MILAICLCLLQIIIIVTNIVLYKIYIYIGGRGPIICRPSAEEEMFCTNPRMRGPDESDYCNATVDCTSSCRCFDGMNPRMTNTDEFTMNGIDGQGKKIS